MPQCSSCGLSNRALARFCDQCGTSVAAEAEPVRKIVAAVFGDLVGSTACTNDLILNQPPES